VKKVRLLMVAALLATLVALAPGARAEAGVAKYPVVLIPGWLGQGEITFQELIPKLQANGLTVLDFDTNKAGVQALNYAPTASGQHISYLAGKVVQPKIQAALAAAGYPANQPVNIIAHSMGGLVSRFLVEKPGADVEYWNTNGWYGDGVADVRTDWAARVDDLIMIGTPNRGTWTGWVGSKLPSFVQWNTSAGDMAANSLFLQKMGYTEKSGEQYTTIGGDPSYLRFLQWDLDGDGVKRGFDGVVPASRRTWSTRTSRSWPRTIRVRSAPMRRWPSS
jgi:triacylglycerol esterase/lipase EstA (alpha/beta hydrolase family)